MGLKLHWKIFIGLGLGVAAGFAAGQDAILAGDVRFYDIFDFMGEVFIRLLRMIILPLIVSSIITGVCGVGSSGIGRLSLKTFTYYITTSLLAVLVGLVIVNIISPGIEDGQPVLDKLNLEPLSEEIQQEVGDQGKGELVRIFIRMIPTNPIRAVADGDILGTIFFCLLFGFFITQLPDKKRDLIQTFWEAVFEVMMKLTGFIISFTPLGVFGLIARTVAVTGFGAFRPLAFYFIAVLLALFIHFFVTLPLILRFVAGVNPVRHYRAMAPALLTAFSTSSSSATLPLSLECVEKNAGASNRITSFVLPLGATVNMDGTALYECVAAIFIAQAYGLELTAGMQFIIVITALLASIGAAGIPSAGLVMISIILNAIGLPLEAVGLILAVDRILDMCRTTVNVFSDSCGAIVIASSEGETDLLKGETAKLN